MSGYRFCRTDDISLIVQAYNACRAEPLSDEPALTVEAFKLAARETGLWASSCMLAIEADEPVGVMLGSKTVEGNFIHRIALRPDYQRRGHGRHLLDSLRSKVAILGPPRLTAEVPAAWEGACRFFERSGFVAEARYADFVAEDLAAAPVGLAGPVTIEELLESGAMASPSAWECSRDVIRRRSRDLEGLAIASDVQVEAHAVYRTATEGRHFTEISSLGASRPELLGVLLGDLKALHAGPIRIARACADTAAAQALGGLGFRVETEYIGYAAKLA
jgi:GNAT superfamily N-acetyltransferase